MRETGYFHSLKVSPPKILIRFILLFYIHFTYTKGKIVTLQWRNLEGITLTKRSNLTSSVMGKIDIVHCMI